jgi:hypothetical protein
MCPIVVDPEMSAQKAMQVLCRSDDEVDCSV